MEHPLLAELTVAEVLKRWPQTIPVFLHHGMACIGCAMAPFETLADVAAIYGLQLSRFLGELQRTIQPPMVGTELRRGWPTSAPSGLSDEA